MAVGKSTAASIEIVSTAAPGRSRCHLHVVVISANETTVISIVSTGSTIRRRRSASDHVALICSHAASISSGPGSPHAL